MLKKIKQSFSFLKPKVSENYLEVLNKPKISKLWIKIVLGLMIWAILEEVTLASSDLVTVFFVNDVRGGPLQSQIDILNTGLLHPRYFVGQIMVAGLTAVSQYYLLVISILFGVNYGIGVYTSQFFGSKQYQNLRNFVLFKIQVGLCISIFFIIIGELFPKQVLGFIINNTKNIDSKFAQQDKKAIALSVSQGVDFLRYVVISYPLLAINLSFITTLRETKRPFVSFFASFIAFLGSVFFLLFLVSPNQYNIYLGKFKGLYIYGAATAVILGKVIQSILVILFVKIKKYEFFPNRIWFKDPHYKLLSFKKMIVISLNECFWATSLLLQVKFFSTKGIIVLTANSLFSSILTLLIFPAYHGLSAAILVLVGNNLGSNNLKSAELNSKRLLFLTVIIGSIIGVMLFVIGLCVPFIFPNNDPATKILISKFLYIYAGFVLILMLSGTFYSILRSGGLVWQSFLTDSFYNLFFTDLIMFCLIFFTPLDIIWVFIIARSCDLIKILPVGILYFRKKWINNLVNKQTHQKKQVFIDYSKI